MSSKTTVSENNVRQSHWVGLSADVVKATVIVANEADVFDLYLRQRYIIIPSESVIRVMGLKHVHKNGIHIPISTCNWKENCDAERT